MKKSFIPHDAQDALEASFMFFDFCETAGARLSVELIRLEYECSRATAFRWIGSYRRFKQKQSQLLAIREPA